MFNTTASILIDCGLRWTMLYPTHGTSLLYKEEIVSVLPIVPTSVYKTFFKFLVYKIVARKSRTGEYLFVIIWWHWTSTYICPLYTRKDYAYLQYYLRVCFGIGKISFWSVKADSQVRRGVLLDCLCWWVCWGESYW